MLKITGVICFMLLIAGARSGTLLKEEDIQKLNSAASTVVDTIDDALTHLEDAIEGFKKHTWNKVDAYKTQAANLINKVRSFVEYSSNKLEYELSRLIKQNISDTTCNLVGHFRKQAMYVFDNVTSCLEGTVDTSFKKIHDISDAGSNVTNELQKCRKNTISCSKNAINLKSGLMCVSESADGAKAIIRNVPIVIGKFAQIGLTVASIPQKLQFCAAMSPIEIIRDHYISVITKFPECMVNKISDKITNIWSKISMSLQLLKQKFSGMDLPSSEDILNTVSNAKKNIIKTESKETADFNKLSESAKNDIMFALENLNENKL